MKNLKLVIRNIKTYPILKYAVFTYSLLCFMIIGLNIWHYFSVRLLVEENIIANKNFIETLTIVNDTTNQSYHIATSDIIKPIDKQQQYEYKQFLEKYFEHQSYYLNFWLSLLAIVIGIFAIIIPICFTKFFEDKRKDMENIIRDCKKEKHLSEINMSEMKKQLLQVEDLAKEVKANSMLSYIGPAIEQKNYEHALLILNESISVKQTAENLFIRASYYYGENKLTEAINDLKSCIDIKENNSAYVKLGCALIEDHRYDEAIETIKKGISLYPEETSNYYNLTEAYICTSQFDLALNSLNIFLIKQRQPYILKKDKENWKKYLFLTIQNDTVHKIINIIDTQLQEVER